MSDCQRIQIRKVCEDRQFQSASWCHPEYQRPVIMFLFTWKAILAKILVFGSFLSIASAFPLDIRNDGPRGDFDPQIEQLFDQYNVPYGVLGAISHIIMVYTLVCHLFGRIPLMPWKYLSQHLIDVIITSCMAIVTVTLAALNASEVRESRALVMLLAMHIIFGLVMDAVIIQRYFNRERRGLMVQLAGWVCVLCVAGLLSSQMLAHMTGGLPFPCCPFDGSFANE